MQPSRAILAVSLDAAKESLQDFTLSAVLGSAIRKHDHSVSRVGDVDRSSHPANSNARNERGHT